MAVPPAVSCHPLGWHVLKVSKAHPRQKEFWRRVQTPSCEAAIVGAHSPFNPEGAPIS